MNKGYIALFVGLFMISGCETTTGAGDSAGGTVADSYASPESSTVSTTELQEYLQSDIGDRVYFETDKHNVNASSAYALESQANWLKSTPGFTIILEGHCDERGTREYNLALGERRANAVKEFLVSLGVDASRLEAISYGKERPAAEGSSTEAWAENRRVVTRIKNYGLK
tara:strand:- start:197 stop:706 length:510 start_codon:yes stop_codon:yes gene_type:complete